MVNQPLGLEIFVFGFSFLKEILRKRTLMFRDIGGQILICEAMDLRQGSPICGTL